MSNPVQKQKMDKSFFTVVPLSDKSNDKKFWLSKSHLDRLEAIEIFRQRMFDYDPSSARFQRVLSITKLIKTSKRK